jgi:2-C-methyl-D-erythritol 4-phosphate cytidylyltransferase
MTVAALVVGAGRGERLHRTLEGNRAGAPRESGAVPRALPKAFVSLAGRSLLARSLDALAGSSDIDLLVPVLPAGRLDLWGEVALGLSPEVAAVCAAPVEGGAERQDSVACGLEALPSDVTLVAVHDAARPFVSPEDVSRVVRAARDCGAALLAVPVADTLHLAAEGWIRETPAREACFAAQTPQVFRVELLREALAKARAEGRTGTDDAGLVAALGARVQIVEGGAGNRKITDAEDLAWAQARLDEGTA